MGMLNSTGYQVFLPTASVLCVLDEFIIFIIFHATNPEFPPSVKILVFLLKITFNCCLSILQNIAHS